MSWLQTRSGLAFDLDATGAEGLALEDIAHALGHLCRYNGHTSRFYSVAEHSVRMHDWLVAGSPDARGAAFACLIHDAHEALVGDMAYPVKRRCADFASLEGLVEDRVRRWLVGRSILPRVTWGEWHLVSEIDERILLDERDALLGPSPREGGWPRRRPLGIAADIRACTQPFGADGVGYLDFGAAWLDRMARYGVFP